eukprot:4375426-Pleurochrysis_carterae.AAC.1
MGRACSMSKAASNHHSSLCLVSREGLAYDWTGWAMPPPDPCYTPNYIVVGVGWGWERGEPAAVGCSPA